MLSYLHQGIRKQKASCGRTKQNSMWEGKKLHHRLRAEIVKYVTKLLYPAWSMRSFRNGGRGRGNYSYTIQLPTEKSEQIPTAYVLVFSLIFSSSKDTLRTTPLLSFLFLLKLLLLLVQAGNTREKFNYLSQATS